MICDTDKATGHGDDVHTVITTMSATHPIALSQNHKPSSVLSKAVSQHATINFSQFLHSPSISPRHTLSLIGLHSLPELDLKTRQSPHRHTYSNKFLNAYYLHRFITVLTPMRISRLHIKPQSRSGVLGLEILPDNRYVVRLVFAQQDLISCRSFKTFTGYNR